MKIKSDGDVGGASGDAGDHDDGDDASDRDAGDYVGDGDTESELDIPPDPPSPWMSLRPHKLERNVTMRGNDRPQTIPECPPWKIWKLRHIHIILQQFLIGRARPQIGSTCGFCNAPTCIGLIIDLASGALLIRV